MTDLLLETPPMESTIPRRLVVWAIVAAIIFVLGVAACFYAYKRADAILKARKSQPSAVQQPAAK